MWTLYSCWNVFTTCQIVDPVHARILRIKIILAKLRQFRPSLSVQDDIVFTKIILLKQDLLLLFFKCLFSFKNLFILKCLKIFFKVFIYLSYSMQYLFSCSIQTHSCGSPVNLDVPKFTLTSLFWHMLFSILDFCCWVTSLSSLKFLLFDLEDLWGKPLKSLEELFYDWMVFWGFSSKFYEILTKIS